MMALPKADREINWIGSVAAGIIVALVATLIGLVAAGDNRYVSSSVFEAHQVQRNRSEAQTERRLERIEDKLDALIRAANTR